MGRLVFVGLGLWDADDMTLRARRALLAADEVYAEFYTSQLGGAGPADLEKALGRSVTVLARRDVEEGEARILDRATTGTVAFVTAGDALTATTHQALRAGALARGIPVEVVHGVSIKTAVPGLLGLSDYKFGRTTTLVFPEPRFLPESPLDVILENRSRGLHTLVLLDIRAEEGRYMTADLGARVLLDILSRRAARGAPVDPALFGSRSRVAVVGRAGSPSPLLWSGTLQDAAGLDAGAPLHCLVVPGTLTPDEENILERVAPADA